MRAGGFWRRLQAGVGAVLLLAALALAVLSLVRNGHALRDGLHRMSVFDLLLAVAGMGLMLVGTMQTWRSLLAAQGDRLRFVDAARIFFVSAIGKYLPGSVWPYVAQVQLGARYGVSRVTMAMNGLLHIVVSIITAFALATALLPFALPPVHRAVPWLAVLAPVLLVTLHPRVLSAGLEALCRVARRPSPPRLGAIEVVRAAAWSFAGWISAGVMIFALDRSLGGGGVRGLGLAIGGYALAWSVGFIVVIAPAGAGVREAVLVVTLAPVIDHTHALVVALLSRLLATVADLLAAGLAAASPVTRRVLNLRTLPELDGDLPSMDPPVVRR